MGFMDDAKETAATAAEQIGRAVGDTVDRAKDKVDEVQADLDVKRAEAEAESVRARNEAKERMRD